MLDLYEEFKAIIQSLSKQAIEYAVCSGLAVSIYSNPRATIGIDLLVLPEDLDKTTTAVRTLGYIIEDTSLTFAHGAIEIRRFSKRDPEAGDVLSLDLLLVTPEIVDVWDSRTKIESELGSVWFVSRRGLIALKSLRSSGQDLADIERLREGLDES